MIFRKMEIGSSWNDTRGLSIPSYKKLAWLLDQKHDEIYTQRPKPIFVFRKEISRKIITYQDGWLQSVFRYRLAKLVARELSRTLVTRYVGDTIKMLMKYLFILFNNNHITNRNYYDKYFIKIHKVLPS